MGTVVERSVHINVPVSEVWSQVIKMAEWPTWYVGLHSIEDIEGAGDKAGSTYVAKFDMAGLTTLDFAGRVLEVEPAVRWVGDTEGMINSRATWSYAAEDGGTRVSVHMDYTIRGSVLGKIADKLFVEKRNAADLTKTLDNLKALCEA